MLGLGIGLTRRARHQGSAAPVTLSPLGSIDAGVGGNLFGLTAINNGTFDALWIVAIFSNNIVEINASAPASMTITGHTITSDSPSYFIYNTSTSNPGFIVCMEQNIIETLDYHTYSNEGGVSSSDFPLGFSYSAPIVHTAEADIAGRYNVSDPANPTFVDAYSLSSGAWGIIYDSSTSHGFLTLPFEASFLALDYASTPPTLSSATPTDIVGSCYGILKRGNIVHIAVVADPGDSMSTQGFCSYDVSSPSSPTFANTLLLTNEEGPQYIKSIGSNHFAATSLFRGIVTIWKYGASGYPELAATCDCGAGTSTLQFSVLNGILYTTNNNGRVYAFNVSAYLG